MPGTLISDVSQPGRCGFIVLVGLGGGRIEVTFKADSRCRLKIKLGRVGF